MPWVVGVKLTIASGSPSASASFVRTLKATGVSSAVVTASADAVGGRLSIVPGEPVSLESLTATKAPLTPAALRREIAVPFRAAALSKVLKEGAAGDAPKVTPARTTPAASKRLTASPPVLRP